MHSNRNNETRRVLINSSQQQQKFCSNKISTCKYNALTFLPILLFEQFRLYSNVFFLIVALLQQIPNVSPTSRYTTAVPFAIVLSISAIKEIYEDLKRRRIDYRVNNYKVNALRNGFWETTVWKDIKVGELVRIENDQFFPADLVLISSSEAHGIAYIETSNLDGESNLKLRQARPFTCHLKSAESLYNFRAQIDCEPPNRHFNEFRGKLKMESGETYPLDQNQVLLRGARLKNTQWILGTVIYTGHDAKSLKNAKPAPSKSTNIDTMSNHRIIVFFIALIIMSIGGAIGAEVYERLFYDHAFYLSYFKEETDGALSVLLNIVTFFILYSNLVPISLQVTLYTVRFLQAEYINNDIEMYDETTDTPAVARTSNLNEELGQIKFLMTDKIGTLTKNQMKFRKCTIAGKIYGQDASDASNDPSCIFNLNSDNESAQQLYDFLLAMSVCHTVVPEIDANTGDVIYQASSPDENSLVHGAANQGFIFFKRTPHAISVYANGKDVELKLLNVLEFTSERKRMSVILKFPDGSIRLYCKGADDVILERLAKNSDPTLIQTCQEHLQSFAENGYRTLCFSTRIIPENFYNQWNKLHHEALLSLEHREQKLAESAEKIEKELILMGATAIEDKLQDFVPETIQALLRADIRCWMLTGDKKETAINIAQSSTLFTKSTNLLILEESDAEAIVLQLKEHCSAARMMKENKLEFGLVVNGGALRAVMEGEAKKLFVELAWDCRAVVCCRMTPIQKSEVVELVQSLGDYIVLAIGDGANDVAMIQAANVGVGITGEEGVQAAAASDYSIGKFHFLRRLLFVHGAWNLERSEKVILYSFYKNICLCVIELWFAFFSAFTGQTIFERWTIASFNLVFTSCPPILIGIFDRPVSAKAMMENPNLYPMFRKKAISIPTFGLWTLLAVWHSLIMFFLSYGIIGTNIISPDGRDGGWLVMGNSAYTYLVVTVSLKALLECDTWTPIMLIAVLLSIFSWFVFVAIYSLMWPVVRVFGSDMAGMPRLLWGNPTYWLGMVLVPVATLLTDFTIKALKTTFWPSPREIINIRERKKSELSAN